MIDLKYKTILIFLFSIFMLQCYCDIQVFDYLFARQNFFSTQNLNQNTIHCQEMFDDLAQALDHITKEKKLIPVLQSQYDKCIANVKAKRDTIKKKGCVGCIYKLLPCIKSKRMEPLYIQIAEQCSKQEKELVRQFEYWKSYMSEFNTHLVFQNLHLYKMLKIK